MGKLKTFEQFIASQSPQISVLGFALNLLLAVLLAAILARIYVRYGTSLSNRRIFANNFIMIASTTMLVIAIVKSSLALSLGLVGALSIVRFRSAIKEPERLLYLFLSIAIGLGFGADQRVITSVAFVIIVAIIVIRQRYTEHEYGQNLFITITSYNPQKVGIEQVVSILKKYCAEVELKRFDETKDVMEASFLVEMQGVDPLNKVKTSLRQLNESIKISFLDRKGVL